MSFFGKNINLSASQKIYLLTVHDLMRSHGHAHVRSIAETMNVSMPSVVEAMHKLEAEGLVYYEKRKFIILQPEARKLIAEYEGKRRRIALFVREVLCYSPEDSDSIAGKIIHCVDEDFCFRLYNHAREIVKT